MKTAFLSSVLALGMSASVLAAPKSVVIDQGGTFTLPVPAGRVLTVLELPVHVNAGVTIGGKTVGVEAYTVAPSTGMPRLWPFKVAGPATFVVGAPSAACVFTYEIALR